MLYRALKNLPFLLLITMGILSGCDRGPTAQSIQHDLQHRLDTEFQEDLFFVEDFRRTGSAPFHDMEAGLSGVYAYYDAKLTFEQSYSLSQWQGLNLGTLAYAIGATEAGIEDFHIKGNAPGDVLTVHGRFAYESNGKGDWDAVTILAAPDAAGRPETVSDNAGPSPDSIVREARGLLLKLEAFKPGTRERVVVEELDEAIERIDLRTARLKGDITLGSGSPPGAYYSFGKALSSYAAQQDFPLFNAVSEGSVDNASRLQSGRLDFGLVQSDVAQLLYRGLTSDGYFPYKDLRTVARLWPEAVQLITLSGSGITTLADLRGRSVAVGQRGSGTRINAILIGLTAELTKEQLPTIREISLARAIAQLESGELDALFLTEAIPSPSIQALAARRDDLHFVSMPPDLLAKLSERNFGYYPLTVSARTYPGQPEPFTTLGLAGTLMTHRQVADDRVKDMLDLLLNGGDELAREYYRAAFISRETMLPTIAVPLHPAAERFYGGQSE